MNQLAGEKFIRSNKSFIMDKNGNMHILELVMQNSMWAEHVFKILST